MQSRFLTSKLGLKPLLHRLAASCLTARYLAKTRILGMPPFSVNNIRKTPGLALVIMLSEWLKTPTRGLVYELFTLRTEAWDLSVYSELAKLAFQFLRSFLRYTTQHIYSMTQARPGHVFAKNSH